jgi:hypothetical protein
MNTTTLRILIAVFLLAHGWVHMSLAQVPVPQPGALRTPFFPAWWRNAVDASWPVSKLGLSAELSIKIGWVLWVGVVALYSLACAVLVFWPASSMLWQGTMVGASALSLLLLAFYWHPWLPVGVLIDLGLIAAVCLRWPIFQSVQ